MKCLRQCVPALALGLTLALAGTAFAQNATPSGSDKTASCCCTSCGDSCEMMKHDGMKNHVSSTDKDSCCCGDSCQMKKDGMKNHATSAGKDACCCGGDSCDMKEGAHHTAMNASSDKHECCCCGDSCNMKDTKSGT